MSTRSVISYVQTRHYDDADYEEEGYGGDLTVSWRRAPPP
eukprot:SAG11_NODE_9390_length_916_cov_2.124847_1_plen_39_part_10